MRFFVMCVGLLTIRNSACLVRSPTASTEKVAYNELLAFESVVKENVNIMLNNALPYLKTFVAGANIDENCSKSFRMFIRDFKELRLWTVQMLDATAKPEAGILRGTMGHLGDYQQCLNVEGPLIDLTDFNKRIRGKYCLLDMKLPLPPKPKHVRLFEPVFTELNTTFKSESLNMIVKRLLFLNYYTPFRFAICLPSQCSNDDITTVLNRGTKALGLDAKLLSCEVKEAVKLDNVQISVFIVLGVLLVAVLLGTFFESFINFDASYTSNPPFDMFRKLCIAFSIRRNFVQGFELKITRSANLDFIYGLRYLSMWWVFLIHTYVFVEKHTSKNIHNIEDHRNSFAFLMVENGYLAVETFLFIAAVLLSYKAIKDHLNAKPYQPIQSFICRVWRLLPSVAFAVAIAMIFPLFSSGPLWKAYTNAIYSNCKSKWWTNILFINNFVRFKDICIITTWYLPVDVQCYLLGIIYVICYIKKPLLGQLFIFLMLSSSILSSGVMTYIGEYAPVNLHGNLLWSDGVVGNDFMTHMYASLHVHLAVYAIGLQVGTLMATKKIELCLVTQCIGWFLATVIGLLVITVPYQWQTGTLYTAAESAAYAAFYRTGWALSLAWLSLACFYGRGGIMNYILSFSVFKPLGQITFMAYLLHYFVIYFYTASSVIPLAYNHISLVYFFFGLACVSHIVGFIGHIFVEAPMAQMGRIVMELLAKAQKKTLVAQNDVGIQQQVKTVANENGHINTQCENTKI